MTLTATWYCPYVLAYTTFAAATAGAVGRAKMKMYYVFSSNMEKLNGSEPNEIRWDGKLIDFSSSRFSTSVAASSTPVATIAKIERNERNSFGACWHCGRERKGERICVNGQIDPMICWRKFITKRYDMTGMRKAYGNCLWWPNTRNRNHHQNEIMSCMLAVSLIPSTRTGT